MGGAIKAIGGLVSTLAPIASLIPGIGPIISMVAPIAGNLMQKVGGGMEQAEEKAKETRANDAKMAANKQAGDEDMGGALNILGGIVGGATGGGLGGVLGGLLG